MDGSHREIPLFDRPADRYLQHERHRAGGLDRRGLRRERPRTLPLQRREPSAERIYQGQGFLLDGFQDMDIHDGFHRGFLHQPDNESCIEIIKIQLAGLDAKKLDLKRISEQCLTNHYSGRDIQNMCRDAIRSMIRRSNKEIFNDLERIAELPISEIQKKRLQITPMIMEDFNQAITKIKSPISTEIIQRHEKWNKQFGAE